MREKKLLDLAGAKVLANKMMTEVNDKSLKMTTGALTGIKSGRNLVVSLSGDLLVAHIDFYLKGLEVSDLFSIGQAQSTGGVLKNKVLSLDSGKTYTGKISLDITRTASTAGNLQVSWNASAFGIVSDGSDAVLLTGNSVPTAHTGTLIPAEFLVFECGSANDGNMVVSHWELKRESNEDFIVPENA